MRPKREWNPTPRKLVFAKQLRDNPTWFEKRLWKRLKKGIKGTKFETQVVIRGYIVDFYCPATKVAIELDGQQHDSQKDSTRDSHIALAGVSVMRFKNPLTQVDLNNIVFKVWAECRYRLRHPKSTYSLPSSSQEEKEREEEREARRSYLNVEILETKECRRQVFTSMQVAENLARTLKVLDIQGKPYHCEACGYLHMSEVLL